MLFIHQKLSTVGNVATLTLQAEECHLSAPDALHNSQSNRVARPVNSWILYRTAKARELRELDPTSRATQADQSSKAAPQSFHDATPLSEIPFLDTSFLHDTISSDWPAAEKIEDPILYSTMAAQSCASLPDFSHLSWEYYTSATTAANSQWTPPRSWDTSLIPTRSSETSYYY